MNSFSFFSQISTTTFLSRIVEIETKGNLRIIAECQRMIKFIFIRIYEILSILSYKKSCIRIVKSSFGSFLFLSRSRNEHGFLLIHNPAINRSLMASIIIGKSVFVLNVIKKDIFLRLITHNSKESRLCFHPMKIFNKSIMAKRINFLESARTNIKKMNFF